MLNTCSIGRRWKSREGWSRPVLTGERGTLFPTRLLGRVSSCGGFSLDGKECCFLWSRDERSKRFARVRCPVPGPPRSESWLVPLPAAGSSGWPLYWFCGGHGPGETPGPFPNPEAKAWHGDGTALERVWESSTPPHSTSGFPSSVTLREPLFLFFFRCLFPAACGRLPFHNTPPHHMVCQRDCY